MLDLPDVQRYLQPVARRTDPASAHDAARVVRPGNGPLVAAIRRVLRDVPAQTAWEIAEAVEAEHPRRWQSDTIRSACARANLLKLERGGKSPGGRSCCLYCLPGWIDDSVIVRDRQGRI